MHPWEDFAETFAHYLHIVDTLETANAFGVRVRPKIHNGTLEAKVDFDSYHPRGVMALINAWLPLTFAMNCLNRSMGQPDLVLSQEVIGKLGYIDALVHNRVAEVGDREILAQARQLRHGADIATTGLFPKPMARARQPNGSLLIDSLELGAARTSGTGRQDWRRCETND